MFFLIAALLVSSPASMFNLVVNIERTVRSENKAETVKGLIFYQPPDDILLHVTEPVNQWIRFRDQSLLIYYPEHKQAFRILGNAPFTLLFFQAFVGVMQEGLGLTEMGFTLSRSEIRNDTLITYWLPPEKAKRMLGPVLIGMINDRISFMEVRNGKGKIIGRLNYGDYRKVSDVWLPLKISAFRVWGRDTTFETVTYSNPRMNVNLPQEVIDFKIPEDTEVREVRW